MPHRKMRLFVSLILATLLVATIGYAKAGTETFTVPPGQEVVRTVGLSKGDKVSGSITVSGGTGYDIDFYVSDPNENTILRYDGAKQTSFSFTASTTGTYTMHFDNSPRAYSVFSSKSVTLDNTITKALFGLAPELFSILLLIIATVIVIGATVLAFVLKWRKSAIPPVVNALSLFVRLARAYSTPSGFLLEGNK
jgi:hypothetical protein